MDIGLTPKRRSGWPVMIFIACGSVPMADAKEVLTRVSAALGAAFEAHSSQNGQAARLDHLA